MANKLYYGGGRCTIEGNVIAVELRFRGNIKIEDKTSDSYVLMSQGNGIMIFPIKQKPEYLNDLFDYKGELKIISVIAVGIEKEKAPTTIHRVMDYTELLTGDTESMTINTEDLKVTHVAGAKIGKTELNQPDIKNLNTSDGAVLYLENGDIYTGYYHIHLLDNSVMTGGDMTEDSQLLYIKQTDGKLVSTYNPKHIPPGLRIRRIQGREKRRKGRR